MAFIINYDHCLCCGSAAISKVLTCTDFTVSKEQFDVWHCSNCTFRFTQNVPTTEYIGQYYQSADYISHSNTKKGFINKLYHLVRSFTLVTKSDLIKKTIGQKQGALLDIGAGTGAFAHKMKQAGWTVSGLEPDETARKNAMSAYNLKFKKPSELEKFAGETFDAITLWHVLEHVHELHNYFQKFFEILKPAGRLIIAVPNYTSYDASFYKEKWAAYDVPRHLYHFSPKSMQVLLEQKGFMLEAVKPMWFDSFYVSILSEKYVHAKYNLFNAVRVGFISNFKTMFNTKKCSSVIYIVKKK